MDLRLLTHLSTGYHGPTQVARVLTEEWVEREGYCTACLSRPLERLRANTAVYDFRCSECEEPFQLKASSTNFGTKVRDGAYSTFYDAVVSGNAPNFLLMRYDKSSDQVRDLLGVHRRFISPFSVLRRRPLRPTARRAGWVGCNVDLSCIPAGAIIPIVRTGVPVEPKLVRSRWQRFAALDQEDRHSGWLRDILSCVRRIEGEKFNLQDIYSFERDLSTVHPGNRNVLPKIRQQLQVLVREGILERIAPGVYRKASAINEPSP